MTNDFNMPVTPHRLELMDRAHLTVSGVEDVERFDESGVIMTTSAGTLIVTGEDLHIGKLSLEGGELYVDGRITSISYEDTRTVRAAFSAVCSDRPWPSMSRSSSARSSCRFCWGWAPGSCTTCCGRCGCGTPD